MNILPISNNLNPNFGITNQARIPMKNGTTALLNVTGEATHKGFPKITEITGDIMHKGKVVGKVKEYRNKKGFDVQRLAAIIEELGKDAKNPNTVMDKIFKAIMELC